MGLHKGFSAFALVLALTAPAVAQIPYDELDARAESEAFLRDAEIVGDEKMSASDAVTEPYRLTLQLGDTTRDALWKNPQGLLAALLCLVPPYMVLQYVNVYRLRIPVRDQWSGSLEIALAVKSGTLSIGDLFVINDHRLFFNNIITALFALLTSWNITLETYLTLLIASVNCILLIFLQKLFLE